MLLICSEDRVPQFLLYVVNYDACFDTIRGASIKHCELNCSAIRSLRPFKLLPLWAPKKLSTNVICFNLITLRSSSSSANPPTCTDPQCMPPRQQGKGAVFLWLHSHYSVYTLHFLHSLRSLHDSPLSLVKL